MAESSTVILTALTQKAATGNANTTPVLAARFYSEALFFLYCSARDGTNPTLVVTVQTLDEINNIWYDLVAFTQLTAAGNEIKPISSGLGSALSCKWVIGGSSTPHFTFSVHAHLK